MIYESDLNSLLKEWGDRAEQMPPSEEALLFECIDDVQKLINRTHDEENQSIQTEEDFYASLSTEELKELVESWEADYQKDVIYEY